jgi:hypothetical protein
VRKARTEGIGASTVRPTWATAPLAASPASSITFWLVSTVSPTIGLRDALLAQLAQRPRRLFLVGVDEHGVRIALLGLEHGAEKSTWLCSVEMSATTLTPSGPSALVSDSRPPLPKSLFT